VSVFVEVIAGLPSWLVAGVVLGAVCSLLVAAVFLLAGRLIPGESRDPGSRQTSEGRRREEFRTYLDAIDEQYVEDRVVGGREVAFYLPERDVVITFDAQAYYRIDHPESAVILAEHEMPGSMLGDRLPFETPTVAASAPGPAREAFAELGVPAGASADEIRRAYRRKVREVHPDQGGDEDEFKRLREAYTTAREHAE
jgi:hypothetical protein